MRLPAMLRQAREAKNLTQKQVADMAGISENGYGKIENGSRGVPLDLIWPLCDAVGIPRLEAANAVLPMFDLADLDARSDFWNITVAAPESWHCRDDALMPGHVVKPTVMLSQEELAFGLLVSDFLGIPLMHSLAFDAFMGVVSAHRVLMVHRRLSAEKEGDTSDNSDQETV